MTGINESQGRRLTVNISPHGPDLGDPAVVSDLVRSFAAHILTLRSEWHAAADDEKIDPTEEIRDIGAELGAVFLGGRADYLARPFNARNKVGVLMRYLVPTSGDPGTAFFQWYALQVVQAALEMEAGAEAEPVFRQLEAITADFIGRLIDPEPQLQLRRVDQ